MIRDAALARRDDLVELKAEGAGVTERPEPPAAVRSPCGLADVLDEGEPVLTCDCNKSAHVGRVPRAYRRAGSRGSAPVSTALDVLRVESQRLVHLRENGHSAGPRRRRSPRRSTCTRGRSPRRPDGHPRRTRAADEGRRAGVDHERMLSAEVGRELALELDDLARPVADAVVAEWIAASDHPRRRLDLLLPVLHAAGEHSVARGGSGRAGRRRGRAGSRARSSSSRRPSWTSTRAHATAIPPVRRAGAGASSPPRSRSARIPSPRAPRLPRLGRPTTPRRRAPGRAGRPRRG